MSWLLRRTTTDTSTSNYGEYPTSFLLDLSDFIRENERFDLCLPTSCCTLSCMNRPLPQDTLAIMPALVIVSRDSRFDLSSVSQLTMWRLLSSLGPNQQTSIHNSSTTPIVRSCNPRSIGQGRPQGFMQLGVRSIQQWEKVIRNHKGHRQ